FGNTAVLTSDWPDPFLAKRSNANGKPSMPHDPVPLLYSIDPMKPRPCPISWSTTLSKSYVFDGVAPSVPKYQLENPLLKLASMSSAGLHGDAQRSAPARALASAEAYHVPDCGAPEKSRYSCDGPAEPRTFAPRFVQVAMTSIVTGDEMNV